MSGAKKAALTACRRVLVQSGAHDLGAAGSRLMPGLKYGSESNRNTGAGTRLHGAQVHGARQSWGGELPDGSGMVVEAVWFNQNRFRPVLDKA